MAMFVTLSKMDIATAQLDTAIALYLQGTDLISAITLAGAADEILGKLVQAIGGKSALDESVARLSGMHEAAFEESPNPKKYVELRNHARNEFKHLGVTPDINVDLEREAVSMLRRAIENFRKLSPGFQEKFRAFQAEMLKRHYEANRGP
jgi:hypothetical protein